MSTNEQDKPSKPSFMKIVFSVCAAAFGVQKRQNLERDFSQSSPAPFIVAGILFTIVFISTLAIIVKVVLHYAA